LQEVTRKDNESFENLFRRFNRRVQQSGKLAQARKNQFFDKPLSKNRQRVEALRKAKIREVRKSRWGVK